MGSTRKMIDITTEESLHQNEVQIEGVTTKLWQKSAVNGNGDLTFYLFVRVAVYSSHAENTIDQRPHYITLRIPNAKVDGHPVSLRRHQHVAVRGFILDDVYFENLGDFLRKARINPGIVKRIDALIALPETKIARTATYIEPLSLVILTK